MNEQLRARAVPQVETETTLWRAYRQARTKEQIEALDERAEAFGLDADHRLRMLLREEYALLDLPPIPRPRRVEGEPTIGGLPKSYVEARQAQRRELRARGALPPIPRKPRPQTPRGRFDATGKVAALEPANAPAVPQEPEPAQPERAARKAAPKNPRKRKR